MYIYILQIDYSDTIVKKKKPITVKTKKLLGKKSRETDYN
jgi:hypothetical protein